MKPNGKDIIRIDLDGNNYSLEPNMWTEDDALMIKMSKSDSISGCELDGREWKDFPNTF